MNITYVEGAKDRLNNIPLLVNVVSKRVKKLNAGERPLVKMDDLRMSKLDIALKEISMGALTAEMSLEEPKLEAFRNASSILNL